MPRSTADERRYTGEYQIAQSALEQLEITLEVPLPLPHFLETDCIWPWNSWAPADTYDVVESRCCLDESGERTEIVLSRR